MEVMPVSARLPVRGGGVLRFDGFTLQDTDGKRQRLRKIGEGVTLTTAVADFSMLDEYD